MQTAGDKMPVLSHFLQLPNICLYQQAEKLSEKHLLLFLLFYSTLKSLIAVSYTHLTLPTNRVV